jgi:RNA polymerase sigma-70 factor (ECF subfamily)
MVVTPRAKPVGPLASRAPPAPPSGVVRTLRYDEGDTSLVRGLLAGRGDAATAFYDRCEDAQICFRRGRWKRRERSLTAISPEVQSSREKGAARQASAAVTFQDAYQAHFRLVWRALARLGVREADRMDLTQNVFIVVHRQLAGFERRSQLTTWLCAICRLVARDYLRSARIRHEVVMDAREIARNMGAGDGVVQWLDSQDVSYLLELLLSRMPKKLRVVFVMFELHELSGDEIARLLNLPVGTVRSRLRRARLILQRNLQRLREPDDEGRATSCGPPPAGNDCEFS